MSHLWSCICLFVCLSIRVIQSSDYVFTSHKSLFLLVGRTLQELQTAFGISFERLFKYMLLGPRASSKNAPSPHGVCHSVLTARIIDTGLEQHEH